MFSSRQKQLRKQQYIENKDSLVFSLGSPNGLELPLFLLVFSGIIAFVGFQIILDTFFALLILRTVLVFVFGFMVWMAYLSFMACFTNEEVIINKKQSVLGWKIVNNLSNRRKSRFIPFSKIIHIQIEVSDELSGGTTEGEIYDIVNIKFTIKDQEELNFKLKANHEFRNVFRSTQDLSDKLLTFIEISPERLIFKPYSFIGS